MKKVLILHGPNLDLLGEREVQLYGSTSLADLDQILVREGEQLGLEIRCAQSNHEGELIDRLHESRRSADGVVLNPGGLAHSSVSLRDAVAALPLPVIEVHITNTAAREPFRRRDLVTPVCRGLIMGLGIDGYVLALRAMACLLEP